MNRLSFGEMMWRDRMAAQQHEENIRMAREAMIGLCVALVASGIVGAFARMWA